MDRFCSMKAQPQDTSGIAFIVHAVDETEAIYELNRRSSESLNIKSYRIARIRRTLWQRFTNAAPRWQVTYMLNTNQAESGTS